MPVVARKRGPTFRKSPPELTRAFERAVGEASDGQVRVVFGYPCLFVGGHMTVGLFGKDLFLRLSDTDSARLKGEGGKPFSPMPGRPMAGYTVAPPAVWSSAMKVRPWVERAIRQARSLPPKTKRLPSKKSG